MIISWKISEGQKQDKSRIRKCIYLCDFLLKAGYTYVYDGRYSADKNNSTENNKSQQIKKEIERTTRNHEIGNSI